jgi:hypothetical protein
MRKGIYLDILIQLESAEQAEKPEDALKAILNQALQNGTPIAQLTGKVKRIRPQGYVDGEPRRVEALIYLEGEQEASQNFYTLATAEVQAALHAALLTPIAPDVSAHVENIQENSNAVDELADEGLLEDEEEDSG